MSRAPLAVALLLLFGACCALRIALPLGDPAFPSDRPEGLLRSDPGLIVYIAGRIAEGGGLPPSDFRADPRVEWPQGADLAADFTVGQEFPIAWLHLASGGRLELWRAALWVSACSAASIVLAAFLLARGLGASRSLALLAAALSVVTPACYRTLGFVVVREDLAFPLFAFHLAALVWALRRGGAARFAVAGALLGASLATWHATGFLVLIEVVVLASVWTLSGRSPFASRAALALPLVVAAFGALVPALRTHGFLLSPAAIAFYALWISAHFGASTRVRRAAAVGGAFAAGVAATRLLGSAWPALRDHEHVSSLLLSKLLLFGQRPPHPAALDFDVRLMWQGPFETFALDGTAGAGVRVGLALVLWALLGAGAWRWVRCGAVAGESGWRAALVFGGILAMATAGLFERLAIVPGWLGSVALACALGTWARGRAVAMVALVAQGVLFGLFLQGHALRWYEPREHVDQLADAVGFCARELPPGSAIAVDFVNATALLCWSDHRVPFQPKYERAASRRGIERFTTGFFHGTPAELAELCLDELECRYLMVDRQTLGRGSAYLGGLVDGAPLVPGSAAALLLVEERGEVLREAGYRPLFGPGSAVPGGGDFRVFRLEPAR